MKQEQHTEASGKQPERFHPATAHGHDHYHIPITIVEVCLVNGNTTHLGIRTSTTTPI